MTEVYTIVIPTRERPDVLRHSLKTACALDQDNVEIVVMDNFSSPLTKDVVTECNDKRVKYCRAQKRLSMSDNWECALQNVSGDYVFFLGDDDGILPDAVELAMIIHRQHGKGKIIAWKKVMWVWPNCIIPEFRNVLHMHISQRMELRDSRRTLRRIYNFETSCYEAPALYNSFVPVSLTKELIARYGRFFFSPIPDLYSGMVNCYFSQDHVFSYRPFSVEGVSQHSTGLSYSFSHLKDKSVESFNQENKDCWDQPIDASLVDSHMTEMIMADTMIKVKQKFFPDDTTIQINMAGVVRSLCEAATRYSTGADEVVAHIMAVALKNNVPPQEYKIPATFPGPQKLINNYSMDAGKDLIRFAYCTDPSLYPTVDKAVKLVQEMSVAATALQVVPESIEEQAAAPAQRRKITLRRVARKMLALLKSK